MPQEWDEKGNPVTAAQAWDEHGNSIATSVQPAPSSIGPDTRGVLQKANDWYTRKPDYGGTLANPGESPRDKVQHGAQSVAAGALPVGAIAAPIPTALGVAGAGIGGFAGEKLGETVHAPELGEDVGGLMGGLLGGISGPKINGAIGDLARTPYGPNSAAAEGGSSALKPGLRKVLKLGKVFGAPDVADALIPERSAGPTGPYSRIPNKLTAGQQAGIADPLQGNPTPFTPGVTRLPEPREPLANENPGYFSSIPRERLLGLGRQARPGAGDLLHNLGKTVVYEPRGAGIAGPQEIVRFDENGNPIRR